MSSMVNSLGTEKKTKSCLYQVYFDDSIFFILLSGLSLNRKDKACSLSLAYYGNN